ncbi:MAG: TAXI family TRAP transporter solute-binding subunit [Chloroflexi bacterium]|nr:TAXI family TRAP transporter solute-binding subunit [Chloroflexota bacterium]
MIDRKVLGLAAMALFVALLLGCAQQPAATPAATPKAPPTTPAPVVAPTTPKPAVAPTTAPATPKPTAAPTQAAVPSPAAKTAPKLPELITMTTHTVGSATYLWTVGFREAVDKHSPMKMRLEALGTDKAKFSRIRSEEAELICATGVTSYFATYGLYDFSDWGPQPVRMVWRGKDFMGAMYARKDAGIRALSALKGKRVPDVAGSVSTTLNVQAGVAFGGLGWDDVMKVPFKEVAVALKGPMEGTVDAAYGTLFSPAVVELAASRYGIQWFSMPETDVEGWNRLRKATPWASPIVAEAAGLEKGQSITVSGYPDGIFSYSNISEDIIYNVVKALHRGYDTYKDMHPDLKFWTFDAAANAKGNISIPYHDGTVKYFKEAGVWTADHETFQQEQLRLEKQRLGK